MAFVPLLRRHPPAGVPARPFLLQFARSDQSAPNPNTTAIIRAGGFADRTSYFRYDRLWAENQAAPKNAHGFMLQSLPPLVPVIRDAQSQIAERSLRRTAVASLGPASRSGRSRSPIRYPRISATFRSCGCSSTLGVPRLLEGR